jgi:LppP/LprE lipoprotein
MRTGGWAALIGVICTLNPLAAPAHAAPACGVNLSAPEISAAINSAPTVPQGWRWNHNPRSFDPSSNYNPCATLSAVIITVEQATGSSPDPALLFHNGNYVGTGTSKAYAFTSVNAAQTTDDTVALNYKDGRSVCTACPGPITTVRYQWQGDHVAMLDSAPPW